MTGESKSPVITCHCVAEVAADEAAGRRLTVEYVDSGPNGLSGRNIVMVWVASEKLDDEAVIERCWLVHLMPIISFCNELHICGTRYDNRLEAAAISRLRYLLTFTMSFNTREVCVARCMNLSSEDAAWHKPTCAVTASSLP